jgi:hypothetical protein
MCRKKHWMTLPQDSAPLLLPKNLCLEIHMLRMCKPQRALIRAVAPHLLFSAAHEARQNPSSIRPARK